MYFKNKNDRTQRSHYEHSYTVFEVKLENPSLSGDAYNEITEKSL